MGKQMLNRKLVTIIVIALVLTLALTSYFSQEKIGPSEATLATDTDNPVKQVESGQIDNQVVTDRNHQPSKLSDRTSNNAELTGGAVNIFAENNDELWATFNDQDRALIESYSSKYFDSLQFYTKGQYEWMVRKGYPTPAAIIAAQSLTLDDLEKLALSGNLVAAFLGADRIVDDMVRLKAVMAEDEEVKREYFDLLLREQELSRILDQSGSPVAGYLRAHKAIEFANEELDSLADTAKLALMGLAYAEQQGDILARNRAAWLADEAGVDMELYRHYFSYGKFVRSMATDPTLCFLPPDPMPDQNQVP